MCISQVCLQTEESVGIVEDLSKLFNNNTFSFIMYNNPLLFYFTNSTIILHINICALVYFLTFLLITGTCIKQKIRNSCDCLCKQSGCARNYPSTRGFCDCASSRICCAGKCACSSNISEK